MGILTARQHAYACAVVARLRIAQIIEARKNSPFLRVALEVIKRVNEALDMRALVVEMAAGVLPGHKMRMGLDSHKGLQ